MNLLKNKNILITGLISKKSIAYGIAKLCYKNGAKLAFTYPSKRFKSRLTKIAKEEFESDIIFKCDVTKKLEIRNLVKNIENKFDSINGLIHSIGFAPRKSISGNFLEGLSQNSFRVSHDISSYSFSSLVKELLILLKNKNSSLITLTYIGSQKVVNNYNVMGLAKASLESSIRYLSESIGYKHIRVNGVSSGPIKTLAASGIKNFSRILSQVKFDSPLRQNVTIEDIGNTVVFLLSNMSLRITGEIINVDSGFSKIL